MYWRWLFSIGILLNGDKYCTFLLLLMRRRMHETWIDETWEMDCTKLGRTQSVRIRKKASLTAMDNKILLISFEVSCIYN